MTTPNRAPHGRRPRLTGVRGLHGAVLSQPAPADIRSAAAADFTRPAAPGCPPASGRAAGHPAGELEATA